MSKQSPFDLQAHASLRSALRKADAMMPRAVFRVYCDRAKKGKHYTVIILKNKHQVQQVARLISGKNRGWGRTMGWACALTVLHRNVKGVWSPNRLAGFIVLSLCDLGSGYVSHEMTHAAQFRLLRSGGEVRRPYEKMLFSDDRISEPLADLQGWLVCQFWQQFYKRFESAFIGPDGIDTKRRPERRREPRRPQKGK